MKLTDRVRSWLLRVGIAYDEPTQFTLEGLGVAALLDENVAADVNAGRCSVNVAVCPQLSPDAVVFTQPAPLGDQ